MANHDYQALRIAIDRGVAFVTIDNGPINLLDQALIGDLDRAGRELEADPAVKVVVLQSANPDFFIAHADINLIQQLPATPPPRTEKLGAFQAMVDRFRTMPKATIARIEGYCRGGGSELVLACDMRFAALGKAVLGQPEVGIGIVPGGGGSVRLPRLVGRGRALEIILGCGDFGADVAEHTAEERDAVPQGEQADVQQHVLQPVEEEDDADEKEQMVVAGHHVLGAEIEEWSDRDAVDRLHEVGVTRGDAMSGRVMRPECDDDGEKADCGEAVRQCP